MAGLYSSMTPYVQAGVFLGAQPEVQAAILGLYGGEPVPEVLLEAAMSEGVDNPVVVWALACRRDLPERVIGWLLEHGQMRDLRSVAEMPQIREKEAQILARREDSRIYGSLLKNPHLSSELKRSLVLRATGSVLTKSLRDILAGWQFTEWAAESPDSGVRSVALGNISRIPLYWRWRIARNLSGTSIPFRVLADTPGWGDRVGTVLRRGALGESQKLGSRAQIGQLVRQELDKLGPPPATPVEEARMILSADATHLLNTTERSLPWEDLSDLVREEKASPAAVLHLLGRKDRSMEFATWSLINYSNYRSIMLSCSSEEVLSALHTTWDDSTHRRSIVRSIAKALGMDGVRQYYLEFKAEDLTWMINRASDSTETLLKSACQAIMSGIAEMFEDDPIAWGNFESLRNSHPSWSVQALCSRAMATTPED